MIDGVVEEEGIVFTPDDLADDGDPIDLMSPDLLAEFDIDLQPFLDELYIVEKTLGIARISDVIHPAQIALIRKVNWCINNNKPVRIIVLKARQIGISTIIEALAFAMAFMRLRSRGMIIAHEASSSEHLLSMSQTYFDEFFAKEAYTQKNKSAKVLSWTETKSQLSISTAKNTGSGRSRTIQFLHGSEVAFWENADLLMTGLAQSIPSLPLTFIFMESTANGIGNYFHTAWLEACNGDTEYIPMFFPWWTHPEYLGSVLGLEIIKGGFDKEERQLIRLMKDPPKEAWNDYTAEPNDNAEILDRLTWRRYAIKNLCKSDLLKFHQEYPSTPDEAFISTGTNIFPQANLDAVFDFKNGQRGEVVREGAKVRFQPQQNGKLRIFKTPTRGAEYLIAGDPKKATEGDYACCQVLNRRTWEQVAVYRDKVDPVTFGEIMMNLGMYYNKALLAPEIEGGGYATIAVILDRNYPFVWQHEKAESMPGQIDNWFGWHTNWKTKNQAIGVLKKVIIDGLITCHDRETYNELKNYVSLPGGKFGNGEKVDHDDMVMALAIAMTVTHYTAAELPAPDLASIGPINTPRTNMEAIRPEADDGLISTAHDEASQLERDVKSWSAADKPANQAPKLDDDGEIIPEPTPFDDWNTDE